MEEEMSTRLSSSPPVQNLSLAGDQPVPLSVLRSSECIREPQGPFGRARNISCGSTLPDEKWIEKVRENVNSTRIEEHPRSAPRKPCTIFKVPNHIRQLDGTPYEPVVAPFGPFHRNYPWETSVMTEYKRRCVQHLLSRHESQGRGQLLADCLLKLKRKDDEVRSCYSEEFSQLNAQDMAFIMLLDGCCIIYLMLKMYAENESEETEEEEDTVEKLRRATRTRDQVVLDIREEQFEDPNVVGLFTINLVVFDLLKLENQIPFFIIKSLFKRLKTPKDGEIGLVNLALHLFENIHPKESKSFRDEEKKYMSPRKYHHLLHLFYSSRIPSPEKPPEPTPGCIHHAIKCIKSKWKKTEATIDCKKSKQKKKAEAETECKNSKRKEAKSAPKWIPTATELDRAGVKFEKNESADGFLNITFGRRKIKITPLLCLLKLCLMFRSGRMEIPPLHIYDHTGPLFQNLIAFEQCYYDTEMHITTYALFMDCIIDQAEDVRLLHLEGILEHKLSSDKAVAELFNQLCCQIHFTWKKNYLANEIEKVNKFYDSKWHKWLAGLRRDYFGNPWATISVLAAIFLLLLTVEQAVFSTLSYFHSS